MLTFAVVLLHDNIRTRSAQNSKELLKLFKWDVFDHPPYSRNFASSDFHLFTHMKNCFASERLADDIELRNAMKDCLMPRQLNLMKKKCVYY